MPPDGEGLFGALAIYGAYWNFNSGLYHWLEVLFSGYPTPNPVPQEAVGWLPIYAAKAVMALALGGIVLVVWHKGQLESSALGLLRLAVVPLAAYLLLATTVHPWYAMWIVPLLPFLCPVSSQAYLWPLLYFSLILPLSYLSYLDPAHPHEFAIVRLIEYVPLFLLLLWAAYRHTQCKAGQTPSPSSEAD